MSTVSATSLPAQPARATSARARRALAWLLALAGGALALSLVVGSSSIGVAHLWSDDPTASRIARDVIFDLRLPRTLAAFAVGGLLALAGALMQVLLRNPLADSYVLGVSGGAGVGALIALLAGSAGALVHAGAATGALIAIATVFALARGDGSWSQARLLLTGVAVASFCAAMESLLLSLAPDGAIRGMVFWLLGDLSGASWLPALLALLACTLAGAAVARELNVLALGESGWGFGVSARSVRRVVYLVAALATAFAVTTGGTIGFVGLIVPHALRLLLGNDQRLLLPAAALGGGAFLMVADTLARTILAPQQLPVGIVTATIGAPCFLLLLNRSGR